MSRQERSLSRPVAGTRPSRWLCGALLGLALLFPLLRGEAAAQARHFPLETTAGLRIVNATVTTATLDGRAGLRVTPIASVQGTPAPTAQRPSGEALVLIEGLEFGNGVIEAEIAGSPSPGAPATARGFVGIAFRVRDDLQAFETFYLRPTNGRADDQVRRNHSVQYASHPDWPFSRTRKETPAKYEAYVDLEPNVWTRIRIDVRDAQARLYVHGQAQPTLIVNDLKLGGQARGAVALSPGVNAVCHFRNLTITPAPAADAR